MAHSFPNSFGVPTDAEGLELVTTAIYRIVTFGQARIQNGKQLTEADLDKLIKLKESIEASISATSGPAVNYAQRGRAS